MQQKQNRKLRRWELALLLGAAVFLLSGTVVRLVKEYFDGEGKE